ncbi:MAG TPA: ABC transporter substrate binding protein [Dongiaceae bacterium]|nr:ABC transporter substrate binding protein [Dongiaceae bacterium]
MAQAYDILVLQSRRDAGYEEALKGFRNGLSASQRTIVLSSFAEVDVARIVREDRPRVILAVGDAAMAAARKVQQTPVIAVMALGIGPQHNLTGVTMFAPPERYCNLFHLMKVRRVGIIHNPARTGRYLRQARQEAEKAGIELVVREVSSPRETLAQLSLLAGKVDALWMLPDITAVTRETTEAYFRFGQDQNIPVISFAGSYLGLGAAAVVEIDRTELGRQAADMAAGLLGGATVDVMPFRNPRGTTYKTNSAVLKKFGLTIDEINKLNQFKD